MRSTGERVRRFHTVVLLVSAISIASAMTIMSCGSGGSSDGTICSQCGDSDGQCVSPHKVESGEGDADLLCDAGNDECTVTLLCLRKVGSSQRRCFPTTEAIQDAPSAAFECDGARANPEVRDCGNGSVEDGEDCDDSGESSTCNVDCTTASCGDGKLNETAGEECDDGNTIAGDGCAANCASDCGNGTIDGSEECDDAGESENCNDDCTMAMCGDGTLNETAGEECDDGNTTSGDGCDEDCDSECGNGEIDGSEECDDFGESETCNEDCTTAMCGDGKFNEEAGEECDGDALDENECEDVCDTTDSNEDIAGDLGCTAMCGFDFTACTNCTPLE